MVATPRDTLSKLVIFEKYANRIEAEKRRENTDEIVYRMEDMYLSLPRFQAHKDLTHEIMDAVRRGDILPSMRAMQFAGEPMITAQSKSYNCSYLHATSPEALAEIMYLLLAGSGVGYSVQLHHVKKFPKIKGPDLAHESRRLRIHDQIEGWADAVLALVKSYTDGTRAIRFDYSDIRGPDKIIKSSGRKAPGHARLEETLEKIRGILDQAVGRKLKSIEIHDICCWIAWCVVAGGVRRSAMIALFSLEDRAMMNCKADDWYIANPQRGRANNSAVLVRGQVSEKKFRKLMKAVERNRTGEPGLFWTNDREIGTNPCQMSSSPIVKRVNGQAKLVTMGDIEIGDYIWSAEGWTKVLNKWSNGVKPVFAYNTTRGTFYGTSNHRVLQEGKKIAVEDAEAIDCLSGPNELKEVKHDPEWVMAGLLMGDGSVHATSKDPIHLIIGKDDQSYFDSEIRPLMKSLRSLRGDSEWWNVDQSIIKVEDLVKTYDRSLSRFIGSTPEQLCSLLRGLYSANGSVVSNRITLKAASFDMIRDVQIILSSLGIISYYTTNKPSEIEWDNGIYTSKESYDLNITTDRDRFVQLIGFIHPYKNEKIRLTRSVKRPRNMTSDIVSVDSLGEEEVFDITVDNESHTYWTGGLNVSNCGEIALKNMQFCNLTSINFSTVRDEADFLNRVRLATALGTYQATFTDFIYLRDEWIDNCKEEALLGVSITGMCENEELLYSIDFEKAARMALETNAQLAQALGINPAARILTVKPEGTGTLAVKAVAAGVHRPPANQWIKHYTLNVDSDLYRFLLQKMPSYIVPSPYTPHEAYLAFPLALPPSCTKTELNTDAMDTLERIKYIYNEWVVRGHRSGANTHNVSSTVRVRDDEWEGVTDWMWDNRDKYAAISFLHIQDTSAWPILPQQPISIEQYEAMVNGGEYNGHVYAGWQDIDFDELREEENNVDLNAELACAGGACLI